MENKKYIQEECLRYAVEITKAYAQSGENKHGPVVDFLEAIYNKLIDIREKHFKKGDVENDYTQ